MSMKIYYDQTFISSADNEIVNQIIKMYSRS